MEGSVTVHMAAPATKIWELVADVRNIGRFSPETFEAEWLGGATGPAVGARFRGHVRRNEIGPVYWATCRVTECEPDREFGFDVLAGDRALNHWHYRLTPSGDGTDVTESFRLANAPALRAYAATVGHLRRRRNLRDMRKTLERIKDVVEAA
jgi:Polyketide cyclase / dehydrase and lipid transport